MAKIGRQFAFEESFNFVGTPGCIAAGGVELEDLIR